MAKITSQSGLVAGTNLFLHIASYQGTDISIDAANSQINSVTTDFTASSNVGGLANSGFAVGDKIRIRGSLTADNEFDAEITAVTANQITFANATTTPVDESAGQLMDVQRINKYLQLSAAGGMTLADGVSGAVVSSKIATLWADNDWDKFDPVFSSIEPRGKALYMLNNWYLYDATTEQLIRDSALSVQPNKAASPEIIYASVVSGDLHATTDQWKYWYSGDPELDAPIDAVMTGYINQLVKIYDASTGVDKRGLWWFRCAEPGKTIEMQGLTLQYAQIETITVTNGIDSKLGDSSGPFTDDATIAAGGIYANIGVFEDADSTTSVTVAGTNYDVARIIEADSQANKVVHEKINWLLRQPTNINSDATGPTRRGDKQLPITSFLGDTFYIGGFLQNLNTAERNNDVFTDVNGNFFSYPTIAAFTITVPADVVGGTVSMYHRDTYGGENAVLVQDDSGTEILDRAMTTGTLSISFAYSTYIVGGHTPNTPLDVAITYSKPGTVEPFVALNYTIQGNTTQAFPLTPTLDPSYVA